MPALNIWIQCPLKMVESASHSDYILELDFDQPIGGGDSSPFRKTRIKIPSGDVQKISVVPVLPGVIYFQPTSSVDASSPVGLSGTVHLLTHELVLREIKKSLNNQISVPYHIFYEDVELDNEAVDFINNKLTSKTVIKDGREISNLQEKRELFLKGEINIRVGNNDHLGKVSKNASDQHLLTLTFGGSIFIKATEAHKLNSNQVVDNWPIPLGYFYKAIKDSSAVFFSNNHVSHPLLKVLSGDPPKLWTRVRVAKISWKIEEHDPPVPQTGIESYVLRINRSGETIEDLPIPVSGETFIQRRPGDVTFTVVHSSNSSILPIRTSDSDTFENSKIINNDQDRIVLWHLSTLGTYGVISLGTREDAVTFIKRLEELGLSPIAVPARYDKPRSPPSRDEIENIFTSSPDWLYLGGHFIEDLHNEPAGSSNPPTRIRITFLSDRIEIIHPDGNKNLSKVSDLKIHLNLKVVVFGGCNILREASLTKLSNIANLLKNSDLYPLILAWRCTTSETLVDHFLGGKTSPILKTKKDFFSQIESADLSNQNKIKDTWLNTARDLTIWRKSRRSKWVNRPARAAVMNTNGKVSGFAINPGKRECEDEGDVYDINIIFEELWGI